MGDPWQLRPSAVVTVPQVLLVWLLSSLLLLLLKWRMLGDPFYWDELACYFSQVYEMTHRLSAYLASRPMYVRSPLLTSVLALLHHYVNDSRELQRATVLLFCALAPASAYALACQLGGTRRTGILAAVLCGLTPAFFAQAGLVQMDLPATGLCTLAFVCLLRGELPWVRTPGRSGGADQGKHVLDLSLSSAVYVSAPGLD
jgi:4-amino-4-deoxy-L-arabinose transferase-like glycosyltransferase